MTCDERSSEFVFNVTVEAGLKMYGSAASNSIKKKLQEILSKETWVPAKLSKKDLIKLHGQIIPSKMFLNEKFLPNGDFDKLKSGLVAGGQI